MVIGLVAIAGGLAVQVLFRHKPVVPLLLMAVPLLLVPAGLYLVVRPFADACVRCDRALKLACVRFPAQALGDGTAALGTGDVVAALRSLGPATPEAGAWVDLWYCPSCRSAAVWRSSGARVVLDGAGATALVERVVGPPVDE